MPDITSFFSVKEILFTVLDHPVSYPEFFGVILGLISVFLAARANIFTWPTGIANAIFFLVIFYQIQLYSDMFLQFYFCGMGGYGWFSWRNKERKQDSAVTTMSNSNRLRLALFVIGSTVLVGALISKIHLVLPEIFKLPASYPYVDSFIAISSILAVILLSRRIFETWVLWILVDISSIALYAVKGVMFIALEFVIFLCLAAMGSYTWYKLSKNEQVTQVV